MPRTSNKAHTDEGMFVPYTHNENLVPPAWEGQVKFPENERERTTEKLRRMHHRNNNSPLDPLTLAHIIDIVSRNSPSFVLRSRYVVNRLNASQDAISYETVQTGRMLAELAEVAKEAYEDSPDLTPFIMEMDYKGNAYYINSQPTTYKWLYKIRKQMVELAESYIEREGTEEEMIVVEGKKRLKPRPSPYELIDTTAVLE